MLVSSTGSLPHHTKHLAAAKKSPCFLPTHTYNHLCLFILTFPLHALYSFDHKMLLKLAAFRRWLCVWSNSIIYFYFFFMKTRLTDCAWEYVIRLQKILCSCAAINFCNRAETCFSQRLQISQILRRLTLKGASKTENWETAGGDLVLGILVLEHC